MRRTPSGQQKGHHHLPRGDTLWCEGVTDEQDDAGPGGGRDSRETAIGARHDSHARVRVHMRLRERRRSARRRDVVIIFGAHVVVVPMPRLRPVASRASSHRTPPLAHVDRHARLRRRIRPTHVERRRGRVRIVRQGLGDGERGHRPSLPARRRHHRLRLHPGQPRGVRDLRRRRRQLIPDPCRRPRADHGRNTHPHGPHLDLPQTERSILRGARRDFTR